MRSWALPLLALLSQLFLSIRTSHAWGHDGHYTICKLAEPLFSNATNAAVRDLLPTSVDDLADLCSWADYVRFHYHWSAALHFADVPLGSCTFDYSRDCHDIDGNPNRCVAGAINNYTTQLLAYNSGTPSDYNLTESLLFLAHFVGDIHQPLHCGHIGDKGGNLIDVHWYRTKTNLHHVWDTSMIESEEFYYYDQSVNGLINAIQKNLTHEWASEVPVWQKCSDGSKPPCPNAYASESVKAACDWAYPSVSEGSYLGDDYFNSRYPIANKRMAMGGMRLAAILNRIFGS